MDKLIFSTNNRHKLHEVSDILKNKYQIISLEDIGIYTDIPETGTTLRENAMIKARYVYNEKGINCFADDTGLEVEALDNAPGVYSARYAGEDKNSEANMQKVLLELEGKTNRKAKFVTVIAAILDEEEYYFEGVINGRIIEVPRGNSGFGYDPIFLPDGYDKTFAELGDEIKNKISHRAKAVENFCVFLEKR